MKEQLQTLAWKFFSLSQFGYEDLEILQEEENIFVIKIQTNNSHLFIGKNGKNLDNIQHILRLLIHRNLDKSIKVSLEVNDYKQSKNEHLKQFILSKVAIVEKNGRDIKLPFYNAYQRKNIHSIVGEHGNPEIYTKSIGQGQDRRLYICKKDPKLTIDIDAIWI